MMSQPCLDEELNDVMSFISVERENEKDYLSSLKDKLTVYLLDIMEEEEQLFAHLYQKDSYTSTGYENIRKISLDLYEINLVFSLPILPENMEILYSSDMMPGFVKIKIPENLHGCVENSRVWRDACNKGLQKCLMRHFRQWVDKDNLFLQSKFNSWLGKAVDKAVDSMENVPDLQIKRLPGEQEVKLEITDSSRDWTFFLLLVPVITLPSAQLPISIAEKVPKSLQSGEWMVEGKSLPHSTNDNGYSWSISLWHHEQEIMENNSSIETMIQLVEAVRDCSKLKDLQNYHIKTNVILEYLAKPLDFGERRPSTLLKTILFQLRQRLVATEGIPFIWDRALNVLNGLNGKERSNIAIHLAKVMKELDRYSGSQQNQPMNIQHYFRKPSCSDSSSRPSSVGSPSTSSSSSSSSSWQSLHNNQNPSTRNMNQSPSSSLSRSPSTLSSSSYLFNDNQNPSTGNINQSPSPSHTFGWSPSSSASTLELSQMHSRSLLIPDRSSAHQGMAQRNERNGWLWGIGAAAVAVVAAGAFAISQNKNKRN